MMNYYKVLEIPQTASLDEVKSAYRRLVKKYHPDSYKVHYPEAYKEKLVQVQEAYQELIKVKKVERPEFVNPRDSMPEYNKSRTTVHVHRKPNGIRTGTYVNGRIVK